jgi:hypothetical protein
VRDADRKFQGVRVFCLRIRERRGILIVPSSNRIGGDAV